MAALCKGAACGASYCLNTCASTEGDPVNSAPPNLRLCPQLASLHSGANSTSQALQRFNNQQNKWKEWTRRNPKQGHIKTPSNSVSSLSSDFTAPKKPKLGAGPNCQKIGDMIQSPTYFSPPTARWGLLDFKIALRAFFFSSAPRLLAVGTAGPQLPASDLSGHCWTSTRGLSSPVGTAGPQPGTSRVQWAPLDLNRGPPRRSGHCWTSTAR